MSAYASLPGSFLPPFFAFGVLSTTTTTEKDGSESEPNTDVADTTLDPSSSVQSTIAQSKNVQSAPATPGASPNSCAARSSKFLSPSALNAPSLSPNCDDSCKESLSSSQPSDIIIAIRSARVDPVELIRSLTSRGSNIARRTANFIARTPDVDIRTASERVSAGKTCEEEANAEKKPCAEGSAFSGPGLCYEDSDSDEEYSMYDYSDDFSTANDDDDDDAHDNLHSVDDQSSSDGDPSSIEFELSISFQGRKYNATRAFPTFVKLRNDLLRELNVNEGDRIRRQSGGVKSSINIETEDNNNMRKSSSQSISGITKKESVLVPELPRVSPESLEHGGYALSGVARSGFALLQATAQHYCPEMEHWMSQVIDNFPCSQSVSSFLWEPLSSSNAGWETIGEGDVLNSSKDACKNEKTSSLIDLSSFTKPPLHGRSKPRSNKFSKNRLRSRASTGTLNSIEEGDDNHCDDHST